MEEEKIIIIEGKDFDGNYSNDTDCPIARAVKRTLETDKVAVIPGYILTDKGTYRYRYEGEDENAYPLFTDRKLLLALQFKLRDPIKIVIKDIGHQAARSQPLTRV